MTNGSPSIYLPRVATLYQSIQRDRVGLERSLATKPDVHDPEAQSMYDDLVKLEQQAVDYLNRECKRSPIWPWLSGVRGIGPRIGGMLVGLIDIEKADTVSALWRYAGLGTVDGKAERRVKGEKLHYNNLLKKTCFLVARQFIMMRNPHYEPIYRQAKEWYAANRPDWTPGHIEAASRRKMVKMFLSHLWTRWREAAGLPVRPPYAQEILGHASGYIAPPETQTDME